MQRWTLHNEWMRTVLYQMTQRMNITKNDYYYWYSLLWYYYYYYYYYYYHEHIELWKHRRSLNALSFRLTSETPLMHRSTAERVFESSSEILWISISYWLDLLSGLCDNVPGNSLLWNPTWQWIWFRFRYNNKTGNPILTALNLSSNLGLLSTNPRYHRKSRVSPMGRGDYVLDQEEEEEGRLLACGPAETKAFRPQWRHPSSGIFSGT